MSNRFPGLFCFKDKGLMNAEKSNQMTEPFSGPFVLKLNLPLP